MNSSIRTGFLVLCCAFVCSLASAQSINFGLGLRIPSHDRQYTDCKDWLEYPLPGYFVSSIDNWGALENDEKDKQPISTIVANLKSDTYHVYLRYQNAVNARFADTGSNWMVYGPLAWTRKFQPSSYEVYLGSVTGTKVNVEVDDVEGVRSFYEGLVILNSREEREYLSVRRKEIVTDLASISYRLDLLESALFGDLSSEKAFDKDRSSLRKLKDELVSCRNALRKSKTSESFHGAEKQTAELGRLTRTLTTETPGADPHTDVQRANLTQAMWKKLDADNDGLVTSVLSSTEPQVGLRTFVPELDKVGKPVAMFACRGQYESTSFALLPTKDAIGVRAVHGSLTCGNNMLSASAIDIKIVDPYGILVHNGAIRTFNVNKDGKFVTDWGRDILPARDSPWLLPVNLMPGVAKQFNVKVHVPDDQPAGKYSGKILVTTSTGGKLVIPVVVEVMPFELPEKPMLDYAFYYFVNYPGVRSAEQIQAELNSIAAHGCKYVAFYTPSFDMDTYRSMLRMMKKAGMATDKVFWATSSGWEWQSALRRGEQSAAELAKAYVKATHEEGFGDWHYYLMDEGEHDIRREEIPMCKIIHENGGHTYASDNSSSGVQILKDQLDVPFLAIDHNSGALEYYHSIGRKVFVYMQPNIEADNPFIYRRQYGYRIWQLGYDGASPFSWTSWTGEPGREFGDSTLPGMSIRVIDGFIDTVKAEGWLAAVNDMRYVTALLGAIEKAKAQGFASEASKAQSYVDWLKSGVIPTDYDATRRAVAARIIKLQGLIEKKTNSSPKSASQ